MKLSRNVLNIFVGELLGRLLKNVDKLLSFRLKRLQIQNDIVYPSSGKKNPVQNEKNAMKLEC